jgi:hypothetical protein
MADEAPKPADDEPVPDEVAAADEEPTAQGDAPAGEEQDPTASAAPNPPRPAAATAAARARRIGGRVGPRPGPQAGAARSAAESSAAGPAGATASDAGAAPVTLSKSGRTASAGDEAGPQVVAVVPGWLRWLPAEVLTAGAVIMAILMIVFSHGVWWGKANGNTVRQEMLAAAKTCVVKTNTYKYTDLPKYAAAVKQCTTGRLTGQINRTISSVIKKYAPTLKATQTAQISRGAIEAVSPEGKQWTVLVFGQLSVVNTNDPKGRTDPFAAQVQMEKVHGKWLMSGLTTVATPVG